MLLKNIIQTRHKNEQTTMSYELAHFLLEQKNFPMDIVLIIFEIAEKDRLSQLKEQKPFWHDEYMNERYEYYHGCRWDSHIEWAKYADDYDYERSYSWNGHLECLKYAHESNKAELAEKLFGHSSLPKKNKKQWMWKKKEKLSKSKNRGLKR